MYNNSFRKSLGLIVLYAVLIVGIFVIQFRSDSIIRKNFKSIRVTLAKTENSDKTEILKNQLQLSYKGLMFSFNESSPATFVSEESGETGVATLLNYEEVEDSALKFDFSQDISLTFAPSLTEDNTSLTISAELPENIDSFSLNFIPTDGFSITEQKNRLLILAGKDNSYNFNVPSYNEGKITWTKSLNVAQYSIATEQDVFTFDKVMGLAMANEASWDKTAKELSTAIISEFTRQIQNSANFASTLTEQTVVSYAAVMAQNGRYNEAISTIPDSWTKSTRHTYVSSPFLGSLAQVLPTLTVQIELYNNMISQANTDKSLDIFTVEGIAQYLLTQENTTPIKNLVAIPASLTELNITLGQAAGILRVYTILRKASSTLAPPLEPVLEPCLQKILESITLENEKILLTENDAPLSVLEAATVGDALAIYGRLTGQLNVENCGYLTINSYVAELRALDLRTMSDLYPILIHDNSYYPHFQLLSKGSPNVWAWTIARNISYATDANKTISLNVDFPLGLSHYLYVNGISPFRRIQIYNMDFRTDPQFEIYNSSGYVYRRNVQTLLLKQRHREQHEIVRLYYTDVIETPVSNAITETNVEE